ncbi:MAG: hypothetical protein HKN04_11590 [Rhodothermaceae bacterium]|nr:hypothetical protein [Rhodothermaceae bacterium]
MLLLLGFVATLFASCDDGFVDPFLRGGGAFSVYGAIVSDGVPLTHTVRVVPVRTLPDAPTDTSQATAQLDVVVSSTNLVTGDSLQWAKRVVRYANGTIGYLFSNTFRAQPDTPYRLTVRRIFDGYETAAEFATPLTPTASYGPVEVIGLDGEQGLADSVRQEVRWAAARLDSVSVGYRVPGGSGAVVIRIPYPDVTGGEGPRPVEVDYVRDLEILRDTLGLNPGQTVTLYEMSMRVRALGADWVTPTDDPEILAQPSTFINVENGYGFVGGATFGSTVWLPDREAMQAAGFSPSY